MRQFEPLEARRVLAVLDLNPGPYSSEIAMIRQVDDWLYLDATVGNDRRLLKTDGETVVDLGPALEFNQSIDRGHALVGVSPRGVLSFDFETDTVSVISTEPGAKVLDDTIYWWSWTQTRTWSDPEGDEHRIVVDYDDIDGRSIKIDVLVPCYCGRYDFLPVAVAGDSIIVNGYYGQDDEISGLFSFTDNVPTDITAGESYREVGGESLYYHIDSWHRGDGSVAFAAGQKEAKFDSGIWLFSNGNLTRYADGQLTEWGSTEGQPWKPSCTSYFVVAPDYVVMICDTDIWNQQPYLFTADGVSFMRGEFPFDPHSTLYTPLGMIAGQQLIKGDTGILASSGEIYVPWTEPQSLPKGNVFSIEYDFLTGQELKAVEILAGDANYNGIFDSGDLVQLFQLGEYEDDLAGNSGWLSGDFNGDGEFDSGDLIDAFVLGQYVAA